MRYQANNFTIETPNDWQDRSIITFVAPNQPSEFAPNVVITRETIDEKLTVEDYANRQFDVARREIASLKIVEQKTTTLSGRLAIESIQDLSANNLSLRQLQVFVLLHDEICVITCTATVGQFPSKSTAFQKNSGKFFNQSLIQFRIFSEETFSPYRR